ncbi:hypothetical protein [Bradyrhizobium arachidis]|uniref:hypothetical protein n=1 Tax=Bradyrhizobium arachidis TaxID=858423 RepID=UPI002163D1C5|nr:hypothetical protein [Bradyrhizobium arachidis]UVO30451.1 hypothetical protein KUF59_07085 [Bradyrhizobium arachidis]
MKDAPAQINLCRLGLLQCGRARRRQQAEEMEFSSDRIIDRGKFEEPSLEVAQAHAGVPTLLAVPVDAVDEVIGRQFPVGLASMVVDYSQGSHASVGDIGTVLRRDGVVFGSNPGWILSELDWRGIEPFGEEPFDIIATALDRARSYSCAPSKP